MSQYLSTYGPWAYLLMAVITAKLTGPLISRAMLIDQDIEPDELVWFSIVILIAAALWPVTLIAWWALPNWPEDRTP